MLGGANAERLESTFVVCIHREMLKHIIDQATYSSHNHKCLLDALTLLPHLSQSLILVLRPLHHQPQCLGLPKVTSPSMTKEYRYWSLQYVQVAFSAYSIKPHVVSACLSHSSFRYEIKPDDVVTLGGLHGKAVVITRISVALAYKSISGDPYGLLSHGWLEYHCG